MEVINCDRLFCRPWTDIDSRPVSATDQSATAITMSADIISASCVCKREREREREIVCVRVREREREIVCASVCV